MAEYGSCYVKQATFFLIVVLLAVIGYSVVVKQDFSDKFAKLLRPGNMGMRKESSSDVRKDASGVQTSRAKFQNQLVAERGGITTLENPEELLNRTVIVTAISQNHLKESKGMIGSVQEFLPNTKIILYDLGLTEKGRREAKRLCNVEMRHFNFTKYPPHVRNLHTYAFKPIVIQDTLAEFGIIFWCDASARFQKDPLILFTVLREQKGFMRWTDEYKSDLMMIRTHPKMFEQLGVDINQFRNDVGYAMCIGGGRLIFVNSALIRENIITPWVDCALKPDCISPKGSVIKQFVNGPVNYTHRFDQAALSIIVYKNLRGVWNEENDRSTLLNDVVGVDRSPAGAENAKFCRN